MNWLVEGASSPSPNPTRGLLAASLLWIAATAFGAGDLEFAHGLYRQKRFQLAAEEYAAHLARSPDGPEALEARFFLAECYVQLGNPRDALESFQAVVAARDATPERLPSPRTAMALFRIGEIQFQRRDYAAALPSLQRVVEQFADSDVAGHAASLLAEAQVETGDLAGAAATLEAARSANPEPAVATHLKFIEAKLADRSGRIDEARKGYGSLAADPNAGAPGLAADALLALGILEQKEKRPEAAEAAFRTLIDRFPDSPLQSAARLNLASALEQLGRWPDAVAAYEAFLRDHEGDSDSLLPEARYRLGLAKYQAKDYQGAKAALAEAKARGPDGPLAPAVDFHYAATLVKLGEFEAAEPILDDFAARRREDPLAPQALYLLVRCGMERHEPQRVESALDRLEREHPDSTWTNAARTGFAEALLNSPAAKDPGTAERLSRLMESARDEAVRRRLRYYCALAYFQSGEMEQVASLLAPLAESGDEDPIYRDSQYLRGMALARLARWEEAVGPLETFLKRDVLSPQARSAVVQLALALAKAPGSADRGAQFAAALDAAAKRPDASEVLLETGNLLFSKGAYEAAAAAYARSAESSPGKNPAALLGLGWSEFELGKSDAARKEASLDRFRQAANAAEPGADAWAEALYMQGVAAAELGRPADAVAPLQTVVDEAAQSKFAADAGQRLARLLTDLGRSDEADGVYAKLLERTSDPSAKSKLLFDRAWLALRRADSETAERLFRETADAGGPYAAESALKLAETAHARGDYSASVEWTRRAEDLGPSPALLPAILYRRGLSLVHLGKGDEARQSLSLVVERHPDDPLVSASLFWLGEVEFEARRLDAAIQRYQQILDRGESDKYASLARLRAAQSHFQSGRLDEAARSADKLLEVCDDAPTRDEAMYLKGRILQQQAKFDEARDVYRQVVRGERTESAAKAQFMIGETYFFQERYDEALKELLKVQILYPIPTWQAAALLEIGKLHEKRGETAEALAAYETVANDFPNEPAAPEAKQRRQALGSTPAAEK